MAIFTLDELKEALGKDVDEAYDLSLQIAELHATHIAPLEEKMSALKNKVERNMKDEGLKVIEGRKGRAKWVSRQNSKLDIKGLCADKGITDADVAQFTSTKTSKYIKISRKTSA